MHALADAAVMVDTSACIDDAVRTYCGIALDDCARHQLDALAELRARTDDGRGMNHRGKTKTALAAAAKDGIPRRHGSDRSDPVHEQDIICFELIENLVTTEHPYSARAARHRHKGRIGNAHDGAAVRAHRFDQYSGMAASAENYDRQLGFRRARNHASRRVRWRTR